MKRNTITLNRKYASIVVALTVFAVLALFFGATIPAAVQAQATATATQTPTTAPTNTPTPTALSSISANVQGNGFVQYLRCGSYSFGVVTPGACLQVFNGSDIEGYSAAGRRTYLMDSETGNVTIFGTLIQGPIGTKCVSGTQSITGSGTAIPATLTAAGISTPSAVMVSLGSDSTGDLHHLSTTKGSGVVTFKVWNSALTPAAASGAATVDYLICGQ